MNFPIQKHGKSKQDYGTPWAFIRAVEKRWGKIQVDLAAHAGNAKCDLYITKEENSLEISWSERFGRGKIKPVPGKTAREMFDTEFSSPLCWLNPEFADIGTWAAKCALETRSYLSPRIIMLTPASIGTEWFRAFVHGKAQVLGIGPRLTFEGETHPYPKDLMLSLFGFGKPGFDVWRWDR